MGSQCCKHRHRKGPNIAPKLTSLKSRSKSPVGKKFVAVYDYEARSLKELSFRAQETFIILDCPDQNWWRAQSKTTDQQGYIPAAYIVESTSLASKPWFFETCKRREAESALVLKQNSDGSFIIRASESAGNHYSLSVRVRHSVKHFRINNSADGNFYVSKTKSFNSLDILVEYYKRNWIGQNIILSEPCARYLIVEPMTIGLAYSTIDQWEIDRNQIQLGKQIGKGNFGDVYIAIWDGRVKVAVKTLKPDTMQPEEFLAEAQIMKKLCHKHLVQLLAVCTKGEPMYIITEFMINGSLLDYLRKRFEQKPLKFHELVNMAAQVASGMAFIEMKNYIHRDLAARNVLVGENNIVKVADFGLSRLMDDGIYASEGSKFPIKWTAPEACSHKIFSIKSDVWSFGILLYEIVTHGANPYPSMNNQQTLASVNEGYRMAKPQDCEDFLYDIMLDTWKKKPEERPTFETLQWKLDQYFTLGDSEYVEQSVYLEPKTEDEYAVLIEPKLEV
ncbi:unnamed protein product, partial [Meganyctiphanes norvegica]